MTQIKLSNTERKTNSCEKQSEQNFMKLPF